MKTKFLNLIFLFTLLAGCVAAPVTKTPVSPASLNPTPTSTPPPTTWWNDTVFYEIFVRSFYDSDGNGIGDFNGITQKLDYLQNLGVTGLWLMPIFPSPSYHGYDVTDYYSANPQYGTMEDFKNLLKEAHKRKIKVIIDLVINHTSDKHPWFKSAKKDPNSPYRNWYIWSPTDPKYVGPWGEQVWYPSLTGYYYGIFESFMPDLNYNNPAVTQEIEKVMQFWLTDVGVDGFRMDAIKHLIEEGVKQQNTVATHTWLKDNFYPAYKTANPNAVVVGELSGDGINTLAGYINGKQLDLAFNFPLASSFIDAAKTGRPSFAIDTLNLSEKVLPNHQYASFLTNHDQNREMTQLGNDVNKAKVAASLLLISPGIPFIYYGEEIGMTGQKPDENIRRPMQWNADINAGFTTGKPWHPLDTNYKEVNVQAQTNDSISLLSHYRELINLRNAHSALRTGAYYEVKANSPNIYAALRISADETVIIIINLSEKTISDYSLAIDKTALINGTYQTKVLFGNIQASGPDVSEGIFQNYKPVKDLLPYSTVIVQLIP